LVLGSTAAELLSLHTYLNSKFLDRCLLLLYLTSARIVGVCWQPSGIQWLTELGPQSCTLIEEGGNCFGRLYLTNIESLGGSKSGKNIIVSELSTLITMAAARQHVVARKHGLWETISDISHQLEVLEGLVFRLGACYWS
jgi:hypothetical protein